MHSATLRVFRAARQKLFGLDNSLLSWTLRALWAGASPKGRACCERREEPKFFFSFLDFIDATQFIEATYISVSEGVPCFERQLERDLRQEVLRVTWPGPTTPSPLFWNLGGKES
eukprot:1395386-Amphidinium_carterae.1